jgi:uncharacterized protein YukE
MFGADPDQLDQLGKQMSDAAERLDTISRDVGARLFCSTWEGLDATRFSDEWQQCLYGILSTAANGVRECSVSLHNNAEQQRTTSGDFGTPGLAGAFGVGQDGRGLLPTIFRDFEPQAMVLGALSAVGAVAEAVKSGSGLAEMATDLDPVLVGTETAYDAGSLIAQIADHGTGTDKAKSIGNLVFDTGEIICVAIGPPAVPVLAGLAVGKVVFDDVVMPLASGESMTQVVDNDVRGVTQAAKDVSGAISGGVRELSKIF